MNEDTAALKVKAALDEIYQPVGSPLQNAIAQIGQRRSHRWSFAGSTAVAFVVLGAVALVATLGPHIPDRRAGITGLPGATPQPISRTTSAAQVAWLSIQSQASQPYVIGVDPSGNVVGRIDSSSGPSGLRRSADGSQLFVPGGENITAYSALTGKVQRSYSRLPGDIVATAFSPDGHWLALLISSRSRSLQLIDLITGGSQSVPVSSAGRGGSLAMFTPDSSRLFLLEDWGGPLSIYALTLTGGRVHVTASAVDGLSGHHFSRCNGPAATGKVIANGATAVVFCHSDGVVSFIDLLKLEGAGSVRAHQRSPFWLAPIFTPDGRLLYLHQLPAFGDTMQLLDLSSRRLQGPVPLPADPTPGGLFASLLTGAYAGGVASTVPIAPDGLTMYSAVSSGIVVMRIPDLKVVARLAPGMQCDEVWVSGDGHTLYVTSANSRLLVMREDGSDLHTVSLPEPSNGFLTSERA
jgi:hypothetical protein